MFSVERVTFLKWIIVQSFYKTLACKIWKWAKKWELWTWCIWSFRSRKSLSTSRANWSGLGSRVCGRELFTLAVDWSLHWGQMMYYLSSAAAKGETTGLYVTVTVWGYFIPAFFSTSVPCWRAVSVSVSLARPVCLTNRPSGEQSLSKEMSRRSADRIWVRAAPSVRLYCRASGISWH